MSNLKKCLKMSDALSMQVVILNELGCKAVAG